MPPQRGGPLVCCEKDICLALYVSVSSLETIDVSVRRGADTPSSSSSFRLRSSSLSFFRAVAGFFPIQKLAGAPEKGILKAAPALFWGYLGRSFKGVKRPNIKRFFPSPKGAFLEVCFKGFKGAKKFAPKIHFFPPEGFFISGFFFFMGKVFLKFSIG